MVDIANISKQTAELPGTGVQNREEKILEELIAFEERTRQFSIRGLAELQTAAQESSVVRELVDMLAPSQQQVLKIAGEITDVLDKLENKRLYAGTTLKDLDRKLLDLIEIADTGLLLESDASFQQISALQRYKVARENGVGGAKSNALAKFLIRSSDDLKLVNDLVQMVQDGVAIQESWIVNNSEATLAGLKAVVEAFKEGQPPRTFEATFLASKTLVESGLLTTVKTTANLLAAQSSGADREQIEKMLTGLLLFDHQFGVDIGRNIVLHLKHLADPAAGKEGIKPPVQGLAEFLEGPNQSIAELKKKGVTTLDNRTRGMVEGYFFELSSAVSLMKAGFDIKYIGAREYDGEPLRSPSKYVASGTPREIDLIAEKGGRTFFFEVKARVQTFLSANEGESGIIPQVESLQFLAHKHGAVPVVLLYDTQGYERNLRNIEQTMERVHANLGTGHPALCNRNGVAIIQPNSLIAPGIQNK